MTLAITRNRTNCRLCESPDLELALPMRASPIGDAYVTKEELSIEQLSYPLSLHLCKECSHLQLLDVIDPQVLFGNYIYSTSTSPGLVAHFKRYADEVVNLVNCPKDSLVVEIGSNDGSLLNAFKDHGMRVLGIDPAKEIALKATKRGLETIPTFFTSDIAKSVKAQYGSAEIVAANNVFAHVDNMIDLIEGVRHLLSPEGIFVFEVSYLVDMIQKNVFDTIYHEHVCHHRIAPLESFLNKHGMCLFNVQRIDTKGGSIRGFAKLTTSNRKVEPIVETLIELEKKMKLDRVDTFKNFVTNLDKIQNDLTEVLNDLREKGKTIVGYGASTPVTTTVYQFELGPYLDYMIDDNPIKQGRFSPGHHFPVIPSEVIYEKNPDCIIILAWQYADLIIKKHQKFLDQGGIFVIPLPEVKVVSQ
ncbi:MAG: hypothetical protein A3F11_03255 [Gammaproteobacteria bacterium RIFCSPHIGHO2_12_FULL_37_14]|nr:MAG: hypothetical protein A3F11_03255 [Gammaproteobacteria bacterium RIFCSPHIGHO2_12_FULL_37_14]